MLVAALQHRAFSAYGCLTHTRRYVCTAADMTPAERLKQLEADRRRAELTLLDLNQHGSELWFSSAQAAKIVSLFNPSVPGARVRAACALHARVIDLDKFRVVMAELSEADQGVLAHRLGWLNLIHPINPDFTYHLDLLVPDHRRVVRLLGNLNRIETGDNWRDVFWQGTERRRFKVPPEWADIATVPSSGRLSFTFTTNSRGVKPDWKERLNEAAFVLADTTDAIFDSNFG